MTFVVVGGGPTGVEVAAEVCFLHNFDEHDLRYSNNEKQQEPA